ncbi:hypothetical protein LOTGIDRAFT_213215 [Lottia gigantea]|uniref:DED domain-containing protein n=1 Tax=Lottia gigantea TaxID=225164 RepID=V4CDL2_LOTGI|nr:hypothetical protein LOTGIDRAFT_213215 [Lottia gigantea]ESP00010.1 hypothetical protein LOTGIDRAFT_213215 [Lottia gigantea]
MHEFSRKTIDDVFRIVGKQITIRNMALLSMTYKGSLSDDLIPKVKDGHTLLLALGKMGRIDETNFQHIISLFRILTRHDLIHMMTMRERKPVVEQDPVEAYLEADCKSTGPSTSRQAEDSCNNQSLNLNNGSSTRKRKSQMNSKKNFKKVKTETLQEEKIEDNIFKKRESCDIRLRVKAEYSQHSNALDGNIFSDKPDLLERQFEKFAQANTILKSRDLGSIVCDIKFCELTYLDAFWRDYINGSLLEALKGVFITDSLKQAVGHESIRLLVSVDEDDYEAGRLKLLSNLKS